MFVYWGGLQTGKKCVKFTCMLNEINHTVLAPSNISQVTNIKTTVDNNGWRSTFVDSVYTKTSKKSKLEKVLTKNRRCAEGDMNQRAGYEEFPQIDPSMVSKKYVDNDELSVVMDRKKYNPYSFPFSLKSIDVHKTAIIGTPAIHDLAVFRQISSFEGYTHIIPYKVLKDPKPLLPIIHAWQPSVTNFEHKDIFKLYDENKDILFKFIGSIWEHQRNVEQILKDLNVDYIYYDMDTHDLSTVLDVEKHLDSSIDTGYPIWNLSDPVVKERYERCWDICDEFLKVTGLTDTRLDFRAKDGI